LHIASLSFILSIHASLHPFEGGRGGRRRDGGKGWGKDERKGGMEKEAGMGERGLILPYSKLPTSFSLHIAIQNTTGKTKGDTAHNSINREAATSNSLVLPNKTTTSPLLVNTASLEAP
jgi:hypothetical protein